MTSPQPPSAEPHAPLGGMLPIAPTPFTETGEVDIEGQRRVLDCMVDQGVDGICILANFSEQFMLTDAERDRLTELCLAHVGGRVPVIVTCSHFSTRIACERGARGRVARRRDVDVDAAVSRRQTARRRKGHAGPLRRGGRSGAHPDHGAGRPAVGRSSVGAVSRPPGEERSAGEYFKIEVPGAAAKLRALIAAGGDAIVGPFDGEESVTLMADLDAGALGTMPSALLPDLIKAVLTHYFSGRRAEAAAIYARILPLINFENRQCGLRAGKTVMKEGGVIRSDAVRHPLEPLHP